MSYPAAFRDSIASTLTIAASSLARFSSNKPPNP